MVPLYTVRLVDELNFTPWQTACCCATQALATILAALVAGQVADRWIPAEKCLTACAFVAAADLWLLAGLQSPFAVFVCTLIFWLACGSFLLLGVTISFTHLAQPEAQYGQVRFWGTAGWMVAGWVLGCWLGQSDSLRSITSGFGPAAENGKLADSFRLGSIWAFILGVYGLTLPHTPPARDAKIRAAPLAALQLLRYTPFAIYFVCVIGVCATLPFSAQLTPLLLDDLGMKHAWLGPTLTLGQISELISLALLPKMLTNLGVKRTMVLAMIAWFVALAILSVGQPVELVIMSLAFNGLLIAGYLVAGQVLVNRLASGDVRASAIGLLTFAHGVGMLIGNLLVGGLRQWLGGDLTRTFGVGAALMACLTVAFTVGFRQQIASATQNTQTKAGEIGTKASCSIGSVPRP